MSKLITKERVIILLLIIILLGIGFHFQSIKNHNDKYEVEVKLREALQDSMRTYQNAKGEWTNTKKALQAEIKDLTNDNVKLNADQKELVSRLNSEKKKNNIISAALVRAEIRIDSLHNLIATASEVDTTSNTMKFENLADSTSHFQYSLTIFNVRPADFSIKPTLKFNSIVFPNKQYITFQFDENKRNDYPVSFSISNSNPYYKVLNIESYVIPGLQKDVVNPTGWQKVWKFIKVNGKYILVGGAAFSLGYSLGK